MAIEMHPLGLESQIDSPSPARTPSNCLTSVAKNRLKELADSIKSGAKFIGKCVMAPVSIGLTVVTMVSIIVFRIILEVLLPGSCHLSLYERTDRLQESKDREMFYWVFFFISLPNIGINYSLFGLNLLANHCTFESLSKYEDLSMFLLDLGTLCPHTHTEHNLRDLSVYIPDDQNCSTLNVLKNEFNKLIA